MYPTMMVLTGNCRVLSRLMVRRQACASLSSISKSAKQLPDENPVKFSESKAASWKSFDTFAPAKKERPSYEPIIVSISLGVFLLYFMYLREENDLDQEMNKTLYQRIPSLEKGQLKTQIEYNRKNGLSNEELLRRLKEIEKKLNTYGKK